ncbi:MAG: tetratricopeptide repeat protein [Candidatus Omnitrophota bacterium]
MNEKKKTLILISIVALLGFIVYFNSLDGPFMWDDYHLVKNNTHIRSWSNVIKIFTESIGSGANRTYHMYRPIQSLSYMVDYTLWKDNAIGYHLGNVIWHIIVALCMFWLIMLLFKDSFLAFITSLFYVTHPMHTEAIAYIAGRADSLAVSFTLLALIFYIKSLNSDSLKFLALSVFSYVLAILSKEHSMFVVLLLFLCHYMTKTKIDYKKISIFAAITVSYALLRITVLNFLLEDIINETTAWDRLPGFFVSITNYFRLLFVPLGLHMEYGEKLFHWSDYKAILGILIAIFSITYAILKRKKNPLILFSAVIFFATLLPYSNVYAINAYMAEHWVYLPSIGFFLIAAYGFQRLYNIKKLKILTILVMAGLLIFYSSITIYQNDHWSNPKKFYIRLIRFVKDSEVAYNNLGVIYAKEEEYEKAIDMFKKSVDVRYTYQDPYFNLGKAYNSTEQYVKAIEAYKKGMQFAKDKVSPITYHSIAFAYSKVGNIESAIKYINKSLEMDPDYGPGYLVLAILYFNMNEHAKAKEYYKKAKSLGTRDPSVEQAIGGLQ